MLKERDTPMSNARNWFKARKTDKYTDENHTEEKNSMKEAMSIAQDEKFTDPAQLEALGFDKEIARSTIVILKELGIV